MRRRHHDYGYGHGGPGDKVSFSLSIAPDEPVTNFMFTFEYDIDLMTLDDIYLSDGAEDNGIYRLYNTEIQPGEVEVETESWGDYWWFDDISRLAIMEFRIASTAHSTTTHVKFKGPAYYEVNDDGLWRQADSTVDGIITIVAPGPTPTPHPSGKPPEVSLRMESPSILTYGEEPVVRAQVRQNDWGGYRCDAYLAVALPDGRLFYSDDRGRLHHSRTAIRRNMKIADLVAQVGFGPLPSDAPPGLYTFYGTLTYPGKNPTKSKNRISNLEDTEFEFIAATPTPGPTP